MLIGGLVVDAGVRVVTDADDARCKLPAGYWRKLWPRQVIVHKTIADDPEKVMPGAGPPGGALATIEGWQGGVDGAHGVFDYDGTLWQLADLAAVVTNHATKSNEWSVGFEMKEEPGGVCYQATIDACVTATLVTCEALGIQFQMQKRGTYTGHPIARMAELGATPGGPDMVGIFGHRMNTERRGKWDPGEAVWDAFAARGVMEFDFAAREDVAFWMTVQQTLEVQRYYSGVIDGIPGPATVAALKAAGYRNGIYALGKG